MRKFRNFLANTLGTYWKQLGYLGWLRFRILKIAYILFPSIGSRYAEFKFVLDFLPKQTEELIDKIKVLDIGSTSSLFVYELAKRGYDTSGMDQRPYQENTHYFDFYINDITAIPLLDNTFDFVTAISVIEHIGLGDYDDKIHNKGDYKAIKEVTRVLKPAGQLLITVPAKATGSNAGQRTYNYYSLKDLLESAGLTIIHYREERACLLACAIK